MRRHDLFMKILWGIALFIFLGLFSHSGASENKYYQVPQVTSTIKTDGILNEEVWREALVLELNYEVDPGENIKPPVKTEVLLATGKTCLYIAFRAYDPDPSKIRARFSDRDDPTNQDWVAVILDTFNDERRSYDFLCNPLGVQTDFIETPEGSSTDWDTIWDSGGQINEQGYVVEMAIPFSSLRFQLKNGEQVWGFDAVRSYPREVAHQIGLFPRDRNNNCYLCQSIKLKGFEGVKPGKNLEFDPTLTANLNAERENGFSGPFISDKHIEAGLTGRWGFTPNLVLSGTVNPDFSQVEADALQLDINEPFALSYPEKRPFFTEGADFFATRLTAVYTRTFRSPSWGLKLTGKERGNTIGAYTVRDTLTNLIFPGPQGSKVTSLTMDSTAYALRYRRDLGNQYTLGGLVTHREGADYFNTVFGVDANLRFTAKDRVIMQLLGSNTRYPDPIAAEFCQNQGKFSDKALDVFYYHDTRNIDWYLEYLDMGKDFRSDLGFIPQVGYRSLYTGVNYLWYAKKPGQWWTRFGLQGRYKQLNDYDDRLLNRIASIRLTYMGPLQMNSFLDFSYKREAYRGKLFNQKALTLYHLMYPARNLMMELNFVLGDRIDYTEARLGKRVRLTSTFLYDMGAHIRLSLFYNFEWMQIRSQHLYTANQGEFRLAYQFDRRTFLRAILQYMDYRYNTDMYASPVNPETRNLFTQILFSYKINPQTVLFLGYSDNYYGFENIGFPRINWAVFFKIGYALAL
ncbi:MAG: DUF5916 domain-containing protein [Candidatus Omnitrophota bacterium]